jgi:hypothetical protein
LTAGEADAGEVLYSAAADANAFRDQQRPLERFVTAVAAQSPAGRDHAMAGYIGPAAPPHDITHGARGARATSQCRDIPVGRHAANRDSPHDRQYANFEFRHGSSGHVVSATLPPISGFDGADD